MHVDIATDISTDRFLLAFRRFISLYGTPVLIRSGNGRNFVVATSGIKDMLREWNKAMMVRSNLIFVTQNWTFSTPTSHHNGAVESLIKSVNKRL